MADKKTLRIESAPGTTCVKFAWNGGGELPKELAGLYTNQSVAKGALLSYNAGQKEPVTLEEREGTPSKRFIA